MELILLLLVFFATFLAAATVVLVAALLNSRRIAAADAASADSTTPLLLQTQPPSSVPVWRQILDRSNLADFLRRRIGQAGLDWSAGRVSLAMLLLATLGFAIFFQSAWAPTGACWVAAWLFGSIPFWLIRYLRGKRIRAMETQFPDALESLSRAMRAGHTLPSALALLIAETPEPLASEFRRLAEEQWLGLGWAPALSKFAIRVPIFEVRLFAASVALQTRAGGKLTEALERLSETIRESAALRGEVRAMSGQARLTGAILTVLPFFIALMLHLTGRGYFSILFQDPRGVRLIWIAAVCLVLGHLAIQRIVRVKSPV